jgi:hypothetical protein
MFLDGMPQSLGDCKAPMCLSHRNDESWSMICDFRGLLTTDHLVSTTIGHRLRTFAKWYISHSFCNVYR